MEKERLRRIALDEARQALGLTDEYGLKFEQQGSVEEWEDGICKNLFEVSFRVWEPVVLIDLELDAQTGDVVSWRDEMAVRAAGEDLLTREDAVQIARSNVELPASAGLPEVKSVMMEGKPITVVNWTFRTSVAEKPTTVEVSIHPGTREVCGVRRY